MADYSAYEYRSLEKLLTLLDSLIDRGSQQLDVHAQRQDISDEMASRKFKLMGSVDRREREMERYRTEEECHDFAKYWALPLDVPFELKGVEYRVWIEPVWSH